MRFRSILAVGSAVMALGSLSLGAQAQMFIYNTPGSTMFAGLPVDATAVFNVTAGHVEIMLTNNEVNPTSDIQNLSDLGFTLSSGQTLAMATLASSSGLARTVNSGGTYTNGGLVS